MKLTGLSFLARILKEFESHYSPDRRRGVRCDYPGWKSLSCTLETRVQIRTLKNSFEGDAIDIDEFGALIIRKDNGQA